MATSMTAEALRIGLLLSDRISISGLKWIEQQDPDLHYDIMQVRNGTKKQRRRKI